MLRFTAIKRSDCKLISQWLEDDDIGRRFVDSYRNGLDWIELIKANPENRWGFIVYEGGESIGFVDLEKDGELGWITFYVNSHNRGRGLGAQVLTDLIKFLADWPVKTIAAAVEAENASSIRSLERSGFKQNGVDKDGLLIFKKHVVASQN